MAGRRSTPKQKKILSLLSLLGLQVAGDIAGLTLWTNKNGRKVAMLKMPPDKPPSIAQIKHRDRFRTVMTNWNLLTKFQKGEWNRLLLRLGIAQTGTSIWVQISMLNLGSAVPTLIRQSGVAVITPPYVGPN